MCENLSANLSLQLFLDLKNRFQLVEHRWNFRAINIYRQFVGNVKQVTPRLPEHTLPGVNKAMNSLLNNRAPITSLGIIAEIFVITQHNIPVHSLFLHYIFIAG